MLAVLQTGEKPLVVIVARYRYHRFAALYRTTTRLATSPSCDLLTRLLTIPPNLYPSPPSNRNFYELDYVPPYVIEIRRYRVTQRGTIIETRRVIELMVSDNGEEYDNYYTASIAPL